MTFVFFFSKRVSRDQSLEYEPPESPIVEDRNCMKPHPSPHADLNCAFHNMNKNYILSFQPPIILIILILPPLFYRPRLILKSIKGGTVWIAPTSTWPARPSPARVGEGLVGGARQRTASEGSTWGNAPGEIRCLWKINGEIDPFLHWWNMLIEIIFVIGAPKGCQTHPKTRSAWKSILYPWMKHAETNIFNHWPEMSQPTFALLRFRCGDLRCVAPRMSRLQQYSQN